MKKLWMVLVALVCTVIYSEGNLKAQDFDCQEGSNCCCPEEYCCPSSCGNITIGADWLIWKAQQTKMDFAAVVLFTGSTNTPNNSSTNLNAKVLRPHFKEDSGYRLFGIYDTPCQDWSFGVFYTYVPSKAHVSADASDHPSSEIIPVLDNNFLILQTLSISNQTLVSNIEAEWKLNINYLDIDAARSIDLCNCIKLRPHIGVRLAWMNQKYDFTGAIPPNQTFFLGIFDIRLKQRFTGVGIEGGLFGDWSIGCGWSLLGHLGGSILYSNFHVHGKANIDRFADGLENHFDETYSDNIHVGVPTIDYFLGLQYKTCCCQSEIALHVGWEQHILWDVNQFVGSGNLSMQGVTIGATVGF